MKGLKAINAAIIGAGARGMIYLNLCLSGIRDNVKVIAAADTDYNRMKFLVESTCRERNSEMPELYGDYREMLDKEKLDLVFICSDNASHKEIFNAVIKKDVHILMEKPLAVTIEDCIEMYRNSISYQKNIMLGFVLRYTEFYKKIKEIVAGGELGRIISIEAKEILEGDHAASYFRRWRRYTRNTGGFMNEKCSHDIDLLNWMVEAEPVYVSAFGSRSYFNSKAEAGEKCSECALKEDCRFFLEDLPPDHPDYYWQMSKGICVYNSDKDIVDHEALTIEYADGVTASFNVSMLGSKGNRTMTIYGSEAELTADLSEGAVRVDYFHPQASCLYKTGSGKSGHSGGDEGVFKAMVDSIRTFDAAQNINQIKNGMLSSLIALAGEVCMKDKKVVDMRGYNI